MQIERVFCEMASLSISVIYCAEPMYTANETSANELILE